MKTFISLALLMALFIGCDAHPCPKYCLEISKQNNESNVYWLDEYPHIYESDGGRWLRFTFEQTDYTGSVCGEPTHYDLTALSSNTKLTKASRTDKVPPQ